MKKQKNNRRSKKKILITVLAVAIVLAAVGTAVFQFVLRPMIVDYAFGKITDTVIQTMGNSANQQQAPDNEAQLPADSGGETGGGDLEQTDNQDNTTASSKEETAAIEKRIEEVNNMSVNQVASIVASDAGLTSTLEGIVSTSDKEKVLGILLSNFTKEEIAKYSAEVAGGISSKRKSELAAMARSRLTSAQWSQCMQLFSKYVEQLRPVIVEKIKN